MPRDRVDLDSIRFVPALGRPSASRLIPRDLKQVRDRILHLGKLPPAAHRPQKRLLDHVRCRVARSQSPGQKSMQSICAGVVQLRKCGFFACRQSGCQGFHALYPGLTDATSIDPPDVQLYSEISEKLHRSDKKVVRRLELPIAFDILIKSNVPTLRVRSPRWRLQNHAFDHFLPPICLKTPLTFFTRKRKSVPENTSDFENACATSLGVLRQTEHGCILSQNYFAREFTRFSGASLWQICKNESQNSASRRLVRIAAHCRKVNPAIAYGLSKPESNTVR